MIILDFRAVMHHSYHIGTDPESDISLLIARANAFTDGDPNAAVLTISHSETVQPIEEKQALSREAGVKSFSILRVIASSAL